jgi:dihydroorotase
MKNIQRLELPAAADMHVHLRQGDMMDLVVPTVRQGGVDTVFVYRLWTITRLDIKS